MFDQGLNLIVRVSGNLYIRGLINESSSLRKNVFETVPETYHRPLLPRYSAWHISISFYCFMYDKPFSLQLTVKNSWKNGSITVICHNEDLLMDNLSVLSYVCECFCSMLYEVYQAKRTPLWHTSISRILITMQCWASFQNKLWNLYSALVSLLICWFYCTCVTDLTLHPLLYKHQAADRNGDNNFGFPVVHCSLIPSDHANIVCIEPADVVSEHNLLVLALLRHHLHIFDIFFSFVTFQLHGFDGDS